MRTSKTEVPLSLAAIVDRIEGPVSPADVDIYGKLRNIRDQSHRVRTIVNAWKRQQDEERQLRKDYAQKLIVAMIAQSIFVNVVFFCIGRGWLSYEPWTAKIFIMAVFAQIASMVFFILRYLFRPTADTVLDIASEQPRRRLHRAEKHVDRLS
jgi:hypothetical protein